MPFRHPKMKKSSLQELLDSLETELQLGMLINQAERHELSGTRPDQLGLFFSIEVMRQVVREGFPTKRRRRSLRWFVRGLRVARAIAKARSEYGRPGQS